MSLGPPTKAVYRPRPSLGTPLQRLVARTLPSFRAETARSLPRGLPSFVSNALSAFASCGDFGRGFVHLACERCPCPRFVAFTCKSRGTCPSCGGKRMTGLAAHLVDAVLPRVPTRQFVLTVPFELRAKMAYDAGFAIAVRRALHDALRVAYARRARARGVAAGESGGVTAVQRFGSGLNLHVHLHTLVVDGVFTGHDEDSIRFHDERTWSADDVARLLADVVGRLLRRGLIDFDADVQADIDALIEREPLGVASCLHRIALGPRRGQRVERLGAPRALRSHGVQLDPKRPKARYAGFDLDASVRIPSFDRRGLERLCRYLLRPPLSERRLEFRDDGKAVLALKSPWPDGTTHLVFTPMELVEKLAALVPRPHENLLVYFGVLAANARPRPAVVAYGRMPIDDVPTRPASTSRSHGVASGPSASCSRSRASRDWATLMKRGLGVDVLSCPDCGARLRIRAMIDDPRVARPFAERLGLVGARAGPTLGASSRPADIHYEPDPDFVESDHVA